MVSKFFEKYYNDVSYKEKMESILIKYNSLTGSNLYLDNITVDNIIQIKIEVIKNNLDPSNELKNVLDWSFIVLFTNLGVCTDSLVQIIDYDNIMPNEFIFLLKDYSYNFECSTNMYNDAKNYIDSTYSAVNQVEPNMEFKDLFKSTISMWPGQMIRCQFNFDTFFNSQGAQVSVNSHVLNDSIDSLKVKHKNNVVSEEEEYIPPVVTNVSFQGYKNKIEELIDNGVKQIIFTGAPGTGKTYLAKEISKTYAAKEGVDAINGKNFQLVQFHTSFDYTDFVEGLRPMESRDKVVEFRKVDGIFKEFCRRVEEENIKDVYIKEPRIGNHASFEEMYLRHIKKIIKTCYQGDYCNLNEDKVNYGLRMKLKDIVTDDSLRLIEKTTWGQIADGNIDKFIFEHIDSNIRMYNPETLIEVLESDSASKISPDLFFEKSNSGTNYKWKYNSLDKKYFFLIDEINRADLSKVLGELMYCFEKDKRGPNNPVQTQYRNLKTYSCEKKRELAKFEDVFVNGFFIPENVIIIGTMNDIDRSVESMDFALRRRFVFEEFFVDFDNLMVAFTSPSFKFDFNMSLSLASSTCLLNKFLHVHGEEYGINSHYDISQGQFSDVNIKMVKEGPKRVKEYVWGYRVKSLLREYLRGENEAEVNSFLEEAKNVFYADIKFENTNMEDNALNAEKFFKKLLNDKIKRDELEKFFEEVKKENMLDKTELWEKLMK